MFDRLGRLTYRRRWAILAAGVAFLAVALGWGAGVFADLSGPGFRYPGSESYHAEQLSDERLGRDTPDVLLIYSGGGFGVDDPRFRAAVEGALGHLPAGAVQDVKTYWSTGFRGLVSADGRSTLAGLWLTGDGNEAREAVYRHIKADLGHITAGIAVQRGGDAAVSEDLRARAESDIRRAEAISLPALLVLLVIVFGGLVAAGMPLAIGALAILGAFTVLRIITLVTEVSVFSVNVVTIVGLGLAIDYGLFVVSRFREEMCRSATVEEAVARTIDTAGRTVAFSGVTVAVSLSSLLLFPQVFLRSMAFGGMAAVAVALLTTLTVLPALLGVLGPRLNALHVRVPRIPARRRNRADGTRGVPGAWARVARSVMRRPLVYVLAIVPVLLLLGTPFLRVTFGGIDYRALPEGTESRVVYERLATEFPAVARQPIEAVVVLPAGTRDPAAATRDYAARLGALPGVTSAAVTGTADGIARVTVQYEQDHNSAQARELVAAVRTMPAPPGSHVLVGGYTAELADLLASLRETLPWMGLFVVCVTILALFFAFGSLVLPLQAVVANVLSLTASFGALVWIFQEGHLSGLLGFTVTGAVEATQPILMVAVAFGLATDYQVLLLSRIREEWDATGDNTVAVANGIQRTGPIITSAALLLVIVIGAFSMSGISFLKMIGIGMIITILVDVTVVRALLVPAMMRLCGTANWWAPPRLRRLTARTGLRESRPSQAAPEVVDSTTACRKPEPALRLK